MRGLEVVQDAILVRGLGRHMRVVYTCDDNYRVVMAHTVPQALAVGPLYLIFVGFHLAGLLISRLAAASTCNDYVAVDVVTGARDLVEHKALHEAAGGVTGTLEGAKVVQRLTLRAGLGAPAWVLSCGARTAGL